MGSSGINGQSVVAHVSAAGVMINDATVKTADIAASNGVVHIIDAVLIPKTLLSTGKTIVDLAVATPDLSTLVTALKAGGLVDTLSGKGPFTVFAPTNEAFAKLPAATLAQLLEPANVKELDAVLEYHVVAGVAAFSKDLTDGETIKTVEGQNVTASIYMGNRVFINNALVTTADVAASNGVIHIIDTVLSMPAKPTPTIIERITSMPELSIFQFAYVSALETVENNNEYYPPSGLDGILDGDGPLTVFAPTNEAFQKLPKGLLDHLLAPENIIELQSLLSYHVVRGAELHTGCNKGSEQPGDVASLGRPCGQLDLETNSFVNTIQGQGINVGYHKRCPISGCNETVILSPDNIDYRTSTLSKIVGTDVQASNGIIHLIDNVLIPPAPTRTIIQSAELSGYTTFVTALKAANLTAALDGDGPFTVFVPSNEAFAKLPKGTLDLLLDPKNVKELQDILKYHVIAGGALQAGCNLVGRPCGKGDLEIAGDAKPDYVYTLEGKAVTISQVPSSRDHEASIVIDKSYIVPFRSVPGNGFGSLDQIASNGIWHVIDQVLMPTTPVDQTLNQLIASKPDLSTFATALKAGRLTGALGGQNGQLTVFAPSNQAFAKLSKATLEHLLDPKNIDELQSILEYHVIGNIELRTGCKRDVYGACDGNNDLENLGFVFTLQSSSVNVDTQKNGDIFLSPDVFYKPTVHPKISKIVQTNLGATNGIVHIIDQVLIPPAPTRTIFEAVEASGAHATFIAALKAAGLEKQLQDTTHGQYYTAFVPSEEAFAKLSKATLDHLLDPKNVKELQEIIQTHIQSNAVLRAGCKKIGRPCNDIFSGTISDLEANQGINELEVTQGITGDVVVDKARLVPFRPSAYDGSGGLDYFATNGIWHVIDQVLMPDFSPYFPPVPPTGLVSAL